MSDTIIRMARNKKQPAPDTEAAASAAQPGEHEGSSGTGTVRVEADLVTKLTHISIRLKQDVSKILSPRIRPWVEELYKEMVRAMAAEVAQKDP